MGASRDDFFASLVSANRGTGTEYQNGQCFGCRAETVVEVLVTDQFGERSGEPESPMTRDLES
jgi:hypothetical protein